MVTKTVEQAERFAEEIERLLAIKRAAIDQMREMARPREQCLRQSLIGYFEGKRAKQSTSLAMRIVAWLFLSQSKLRQRHDWCDHCDGVSLSKYEVAVSKLFQPDPRANTPAKMNRRAG